jgi:esterase/lipase superfamily enzyme
VLYPLWFGTNRKPVNPVSPNQGFTAENDGRIHYGTCKVSVPKSHNIGEVGSGFLTRLIRGNDDRLKLVWESLRLEQDEDWFWKQARSALRERVESERMALVYIHGYNVSFENAALRAAQIGYDLKVPGLMAFYSWPSKGRLFGYQFDEESVLSSERFLTEFLVNFAKNTAADRIHILAHSMGNRCFLRVLDAVVRGVSTARPRPFDQIVLAAPDISPEELNQHANDFRSASRRTTLYVSDRDKALATSRFLHDRPRAGYLPPVTIVDGVDTIAVSAIDLTFLGHGYFAAAREVLSDIYFMINENNNDSDPAQPDGIKRPKTPNQRGVGIKPAKTSEGRDYWILGK